MADGRFTRAQIIAGFWAMFGLYMGGYGVKQYLESGIALESVGYAVFGALGVLLAAFYLRNPDQVADGTEPVDKRLEAATVFALVFIGVLGLYVLLA